MPSRKQGEALRLADRCSCRHALLWMTLVSAHGLDVTRGTVKNEAFRRAPDSGHSSLMRRGADWTSSGEAKAKRNDVHHAHHGAMQVEIDERHIMYLGKIHPEDEPPPPGTDNASIPWTDRLNADSDNKTETHLRVSDHSEEDTNGGNASGKNVELVRANTSNGNTSNVESDQNWFHYDELVTEYAHNITTINEGQWPENFCVNMKLVAPHVNREIELRPTPERCLLLLGGHDSNGNFNIFINEFNQVGMGVMGQGDPEHSEEDQTGPLETSWDNNSIQPGRLYNLSFCYDTVHGDASIWEDQERYASGKKIWDFPREGQVSVFVGAHSAAYEGDIPKQALFSEDEAKLYEFTITNGTTTTTSGFDMWAAHHSFPDEQEVDVNGMEMTKGSKFIKASTTTTTTTKKTPLPHLSQYADRARTKIVNTTKETITDKTVVTETDDTDAKTKTRNVSMPSAARKRPASSAGNGWKSGTSSTIGKPSTQIGKHHVTETVVKTVKDQ